MSTPSREQTRRTFLAVHRFCHYCGKRATTVDHVLPRALGGANARWNYVPSCVACNEEKGDAFPTCRCSLCSHALACAVVAPLIPSVQRQHLVDRALTYAHRGAH